MTAKAQERGHDIRINLTKWIDTGKVDSFLSDIFTLWERGRQPFVDGVNARDEEFQKIVRRTYEFSAAIAAAVLDEAAAQIAVGATKGVSEQAFADGFSKGRAMGARKPGDNLPLPAVASPQLDNAAIVKTIGDELRKMFEAGLEQGKSATSAIIEAGKLAKPTGEVVKVQRNGAGEIVGAVKQLVYDGNG